jgi:hypothetical protein
VLHHGAGPAAAGDEAVVVGGAGDGVAGADFGPLSFEFAVFLGGIVRDGFLNWCGLVGVGVGVG